MIKQEKSDNMDSDENFDDIINMERPWPMDILRKHPKMPPDDRAKIFAPFAALRGHSERLGEEDVKLMKCRRAELSEEEAEILSDKLLQVKKGMVVTLTCFQPDKENSETGYNLTLTGTVTAIDGIYRIIKINAGRKTEKGSADEIIKFDNLLDLTGEEIVDIDSFLGLE